MTYFAALIWVGELLYQLGKAMAPDGSITEARASNKLNNGVVALMFVVVATLSLGYGNVRKPACLEKGQVGDNSTVCATVPISCVALQLRQAHNITNVLDKVHLQLDRMNRSEDEKC